MKLIVLLMLSTLIVEGIAMHTCGRPVPESCRNNSRIRIMKSDKHYRLNLCKNHPDCLHRSPEEWFDCNDVCEVCRSLPGQPGTNTQSSTQGGNIRKMQLVKTFKLEKGGVENVSHLK